MKNLDANLNNLVIIENDGKVSKNISEFEKLERWISENNGHINSSVPSSESIKDFKDLEDFCKKLVKTLKTQENPILQAISMLEEHGESARKRRLLFEKEVEEHKRLAKVQIEREFLEELDGVNIPIEISAVFGKREIEEIIQSFKKGATEKNLKNKLLEALEEVKSKSFEILERYHFIKDVLSNEGLDEFIPFIFTKDRYSLSISDLKAFALGMQEKKKEIEERQRQKELEIQETQRQKKIEAEIERESQKSTPKKELPVQEEVREKQTLVCKLEIMGVAKDERMQLNKNLHSALHSLGFEFKVVWGLK